VGNPSEQYLTQNEQVLLWLQNKSLTALEALREFGCFRLAARVEELRKQGHNIITETVSVGPKSYARYFLIKGKTNEQFLG
jgi:hypothetical protein